MESFRFINPFDDTQVHEDAVWGESEQEGFDVESIHADVSAILLDDLKHVSAMGRTRVRFLAGRNGIGKSHLFSRLRRQIGGQAAFVFASIPPLQPEALHRWLLAHVIKGLQHKRFVEGLYRPYTQIEAFIYRLLKEKYDGLAGDTEDTVHNKLLELDDSALKQLLTAVRENIAGPQYDDAIVGALLNVLRRETRRVAMRWLSGSENLGEDDLALLGLTAPMDEEDVREWLVMLGRLAKLNKMPIVLVLDQLDAVTDAALIDMFQEVLFALIGQSMSWYVIVSLIRPRFNEWFARFNNPMKQRLASQMGGQAPVIELNAIADKKQKHELLMQRLSTPALIEARKARAIYSTTFPLTLEDVEQLTASGEVIVPRLLLQQASAIYLQRINGQPITAASPVRRSLDDVIREAFELRRSRIDEDALTLGKAEIADRVAEVVRLVAISNGMGQAAESQGSLEGSKLSSGTHNVFQWDGLKLEIIGHHVHNRSAFPTFAQNALDIEDGAIFVRLASAPVSGAASRERFEKLKAKHDYIELTNPVLADLEAMMQLLADMRAGDFLLLETDPEPTNEAVINAASSLPVLGTLKLALVIQGRLTGKAVKSENPAPAPEMTAAKPIDKSPSTISGTLADKIRDIMLPLRWLAVERLCWLLRRQHGIELESTAIAESVHHGPLKADFELYPSTVLSPGVPQILIYNGADRA